MQVIETYWRHPITVSLQNGLEHTFHSVEDAIDFLENEWPTKSGKHYRRALDICRGAVSRTVVPEAAREAFIAACYEARVRPSFSLVGPSGDQTLIARFQ